MAIYYARATGNINAAIWATTPTGTAGSYYPFDPADVLMANGFNPITINVNLTVAEIRNDNVNGASNGGVFFAANGVVINANVYTTTGITVAGPLRVTGTNSATINGNIYGTGLGGGVNGNGGGNLTPGSWWCLGLLVDTTGTVTINGTVFAGLNTNNFGIWVHTGTAVVNGAIVGSPGNSSSTGAYVGANGTLTVNGTVNGSSLGPGITNIGTTTINGNVTGGTGSAAVSNTTGTVTINGTATGGLGAPGAINTSTGQMTVTRAKGNSFGSGATGVTSAVGVFNASTGVCTVSEIEYGPLGQSPTAGVITFPNATTNKAIVYKGGGLFKTLVDANAAGLTPTASDVRSGTTYNLGSSTGTCVIPAANTVVAGTPVDNTVGTAVISAAIIWDELTSNSRVSGSYGERLKDTATTTSTGQQLADSL